jgi:nucleoside-diphosphate-sugar epimerase
MLETISILGSGWLGLPLACELQQAGYSIKASSRSSARISQIQQAGIEACQYDIESVDNDRAFLDADILIINITSKNINAFKSLINRIETSTISKVLFISSTSVYADSDNPNQAAITEADLFALKPCPLLEIEELFQKNSHFETSIIRFAGLIGYQRHPGRFFSQKQEDGSIKYKPIKNPNAPINMIHRDDCIGIIKALIQQNCWKEIFNACASDHPNRKEFYTHAVKNYSGKYSIEMNFINGSQQSYKIIANDKVQKLLNYQFLQNDLLKISYSK